MAMLGGLALCGATATTCYHWGHDIKGKVEHFNSITRVIDLKWLDDLLKEKTTNLLVLVSGRVASAAPFICKFNGPLGLGVVFEDKVICGHALNVGTSLTFVGEAVRDKAGNLMIQKSEEQRLMVFSEEGSFDKMVENMKSDSEFYIFYSKIFGTIAVAIVVMYGVDFVRKVVLPYVRKKRAENAESDSEDDL
ncbi:PREDICTED: uncharacterized protein LOC104743308 [Camelina sativa]|uniref:RING-type E3 ubiquitin transferase n=1 Tax=Camelina sativa TaxID=90675 RepID=A0ABM1QW59_CAMSA|nr:PREDICTED: uncharacterized protein LOC104743308 [Camelina sativa]